MNVIEDFSEVKAEDGAAQTSAGADGPGLDRIRQLLTTKDDTSRFMGLVLLKSTLDNSEAIRDDEEVISSLWDAIPSKFLTRLLRTHSQRQDPGTKDMHDVAVAVIYTFSLFLPNEAKMGSKMVARIPPLVAAILHSSPETTALILKTLVTLVSFPEGGKAFAELDDWSPLTELGSNQEYVFPIFTWAWLQGAHESSTRPSLRTKIDVAIQSLILTWKEKDPHGLLLFLTTIFDDLKPELVPREPKWLESVVKVIRNIAASRPSQQGRQAYTQAGAMLSNVFPDRAPQLLFSDDGASSNPFSYLFINLILIDLKASYPSLLEKLNSPEYAEISARLTAALDILASFIGYLIRYISDLDEDEATAPASRSTLGTLKLNLPPDLLLKLSKSITETLSLTAEYLRDRWDASVAGAAGLHPEARLGKSHTASGSLKTLAWDSVHANASEDPFVLSALEALALWIKEDDGEGLRKESAGLMDMMMELYSENAEIPSSFSADPARVKKSLSFRTAILIAVEGIIEVPTGTEIFLDHNGWQILSTDLVAILSATNDPKVAEGLNNDVATLSLGYRIARLLHGISDSSSTQQESWLDMATAVAAYDIPDWYTASAVLRDLQIGVLQLCSVILGGSSPAARKRYQHSTESLAKLAQRLLGLVEGQQKAELEDVISLLG